MASGHEGDPHEVRIVLLEVSGAKKSLTGNAILGREAFKESRTRESEIQRGRVDDRNISIINTPGFFNTQLTDEEMKKQMMKSLDLTHPGPHVFLLIINLKNFREEKRNIVEEIEEIFGPQVFKFTLVLFTGREEMSNREWTVFRHSEKFQELVSRCRDHYYEINCKNEMNQTQITEFLDKIDEFVKQNNQQHYNSRVFSVSRTKSIRIKKRQEEEKTYKRKEQGMKQKQDKTTWETSTTHNSREDRTHAVIEEVKEIIREKKQEKGEHIYMNINQEKGVRKEQAKIKPKTFEMESAMEERTTHAVIDEVKENIREKKQQDEEHTYMNIKREKGVRKEQAKIKPEIFHFREMDSATEERTTHTVTEVSYVSQTVKTTRTNENLNSRSLDRFQDFSNEGMRDKHLDRTPEKSWGMSHKMKYQVQSEDEDLRIVMVGKTGVGKSASGNTILREKLFNDELSSESVTKECQKHETRVDCRNISVIDTPGLFDTSIKEQLKKEIVRCVYMSVPGPHAFLLVIRLDVRFTAEERNTVEWIQKNFGKEAAHYTIILFTRGDQLKKPIEEFLTKNRQINELVRKCGGRYHVFDNTNEDPQQVTELLKTIQIMVNKNGGGHYTNEMYKEAQRKIMMKKVQETALVGASVAGVGAAVAGGAVMVAATGGLALPVALMAGGAFLTGGSGAAKAIVHKVKHIKGNRTSSVDQDKI